MITIGVLLLTLMLRIWLPVLYKSHGNFLSPRFILFLRLEFGLQPTLEGSSIEYIIEALAPGEEQWRQIEAEYIDPTIESEYDTQPGQVDARDNVITHPRREVFVRLEQWGDDHDLQVDGGWKITHRFCSMSNVLGDQEPIVSIILDFRKPALTNKGVTVTSAPTNARRRAGG